MMDTPLTPPVTARTAAAAVTLAALAMLGGCASPLHRAPVEDRSARAAAPAAVTVEPTKPLPGAENAGKPGYYTVKAGETLIRIGLDTGQNWRDIARWNNIDNPNQLEAGRVLRVVAPAADASAPTARGVPPTRVEARPLDGTAPTPTVAPGASAPVAAAPTPAAAAPATAATRDDDIAWAWPAAGSVVTAFDEVRSKGLAISGKAGDPVTAAADGRVIYVGAGVRGYGNLVIIKHNNTYLTAYAHNQQLLVKEEQVVRRGQKIAEMGSTDAERVQLHFEIRRLGRPIDPARLLPPR